MERKILHVDVNNAFLSWTAVDKLNKGELLDIRTVLSVIGGDESQRKGIVLAKSNMAKVVGIKTGEPLYLAKRLCPNILIFKGDFNVYRKFSDAMYNILLEYTDKVERYSIDECFMDLTNYLVDGEILEEKSKEISGRIYNELGFTVNVGVSTNKLLAKMASDFEKPNKIHTLYKDEIEVKMWDLPVADLFMVGRKSIEKLLRIGIRTIGDLAKRNRIELEKIFGKHGILMWEYANGIDESEVVYKYQEPKGIGNEITLPYDYRDVEKIEQVLLALTEQVTFRLRKYNLVTGSINVQIKDSNFIKSSHQRKLLYPTSSTKIIYQEVKKVFYEFYKGQAIRLIGVRVDKLCKEEEKQLSFFEMGNDKKQEKLDKTVDELKKKYGYNLITRAGKMNVNDMINIRTEKNENK